MPYSEPFTHMILFKAMVKANTEKTIKGRNKKILIGFGAFVAVYIASLFTPLLSGYTRFPVYVVKCGGLPVAASDLAGKSYRLPGHEVYGPSLFTNKYFCTEQEAVKNYYQKDN